MLEFLNHIYELSHFLNLKSNDINKVLNRKTWTLKRLMAIILLFTFGLIVISVILVILAPTHVQDNTYTTGTFYSTAKLKDIRNKNEAKYWLWKKIRTILL